MFLFSDSLQEEQLSLYFQRKNATAQKQHNFSVLYSESLMDNLRSLNVPFCINIMTGGEYCEKDTISLTSISSKEHFHVEKKDSVEKKIGNKNTEMHQHNFFELMYVYKGDLEQNIEDRCLQCTQGSAYLLNPNTRHLETLVGNFYLVFFCFSCEFVHDYFISNTETGIKKNTLYDFFSDNFNDEYQYRRNYLYFRPISKKNSVKQVNVLIEHLKQELLTKKSGYSHIVLGLLFRILSFFQDTDYYTCSNITMDSSAQVYIFNKVTRLMETKKDRVTRADLEKTLNYSGDYINRIVKKYSGFNISEYNSMICLKKAELALTETNRSINSIIMSLGFENKTYFYKLFERKHGITPNEYRRLNTTDLSINN